VANLPFPAGKEGFLDGSIDYDTGTMKLALVRGYTYNAAHKFVSEVTGAGGTIVASVTLTGKTVTGGAAGATNPVFPTVSGAAVPAIILYQSSAPTGGADVAASAQRLIGYWDSGPGFPIPVNGTAPTAAIDTGVLFRL
jgi:hypothetical protein